MIDDVIHEIDKSSKVLLTCHPHPDPDSVGSVLAMKNVLEGLGKDVVAIQGDNYIPHHFMFPGVETILKKKIDEIDLSEFDLFVVLDISKKDRISEESEAVFPDTLRVVKIDHHLHGESFAHVNWEDSSFSSTCHMLHNLFKRMNVKLTETIATNLLIGMYTDTGGFKYGNSPVQTLSDAAEVAKYAPNYHEVLFVLENSLKKNSLVFEGIAFSSMRTFFNDKLAMIAIDHDKIKEHHIEKGDIATGYISNKLKSVIGFEISATLLEIDPGQVKVSFRTRDQEKYDLSQIAIALGGGGHRGAAGARLDMSLEEAVDKVAKTVKEIYNL